MRFRFCTVLCLSFLSQALMADAVGDVTKLKDEALEILKANSNGNATNAQYATCIFKLEQAQGLLEKAGDSSSALAQEVSSSLFWARRFSNVQVINELEKMRKGAPIAAMPPKKAEPAKPVTKPKDDDDAEPPAILAEAKKAFESAQSFAQGRANDDYAVALRWFQVANEHPGTDYALKAMELARAAQARFAAKTAKVPTQELPDTPEMKLVKEADALVAQGKFEESTAVYLSSIKLKESQIAWRKLGHAYFSRAQQLKDALLPQFEANEKAWREARRNAIKTVRTLSGQRRKFDPNYPPLVEANKKQIELVKEANVAIAYYDKAHDAFKAVLRLAPTKKDLDAAAHQALCLTVKGDSNARSRGRQMIVSLLADYQPANDIERSIYEFCKTELARINKG
ncbi:MAG TPA: hypothetical protein VEK08_17290 [Planctomycetota bacterium]|nr:hypothetical protein [Planctomycetota bacterium]